MRSSLPKLTAVSLALVCCLTSCGDDDPTVPSVGQVSGTVTELYGGSPARDVGVLLVNTSNITPGARIARTDSLGRFAIVDVDPGTYAVFAYHDSLVVYDRTSPVVDVGKGQTSIYDMRVQESELWNGEGPRIRGVVLDDVTGEPVVGAFVGETVWGFNAQDFHALFMGIGLPGWGVTDETGSFSVVVSVVTDATATQLGLFPISIVRDGYEPFTLVGQGEFIEGLGPPLPYPDESGLTVTVRLHPLTAARSGGLRGRVTYLGTPVSGLEVGLSLIAAAYPETLKTNPGPQPVPVQGRVTRTDAEGRFHFNGLGPGVYVVAAGYLEGDGYMGLLNFTDLPRVPVIAGITAEAGDTPVLKAITAVFPPNKATIHTGTPRFEWSAVPGALFYEVQFGTQYPVDRGASSLTNPHWQLPDSLQIEAGTHIRWFVTAFGEVHDDTVAIGEVERAATFSVEP